MKKKQKKTKSMACQVSILGPRGYEPRTLPLRHMPICTTLVEICFLLNKTLRLFLFWRGPDLRSHRAYMQVLIAGIE